MQRETIRIRWDMTVCPNEELQHSRKDIVSALHRLAVAVGDLASLCGPLREATLLWLVVQ